MQCRVISKSGWTNTWTVRTLRSTSSSQTRRENPQSKSPRVRSSAALNVSAERPCCLPTLEITWSRDQTVLTALQEYTGARCPYRPLNLGPIPFFIVTRSPRRNFNGSVILVVFSKRVFSLKSSLEYSHLYIFAVKKVFFLGSILSVQSCRLKTRTFWFLMYFFMNNVNNCMIINLLLYNNNITNKLYNQYMFAVFLCSLFFIKLRSVFCLFVLWIYSKLQICKFPSGIIKLFYPLVWVASIVVPSLGYKMTQILFY